MNGYVFCCAGERSHETETEQRHVILWTNSGVDKRQYHVFNVNLRLYDAVRLAFFCYIIGQLGGRRPCGGQANAT